MSDISATPTDYAAWIGALTGTAALLFEVWKHWREGARVELAVARQMAVQAPHPAQDVAVVTAENHGDADTTITHLYVEQSNTFLGAYGKRWFGLKWTQAFIPPRLPMLNYPAVVGPGKQWQAVIPEEVINAICEGWKYNYLCLRITTSKRPASVRIYYRAPEKG